MDFSINEMLEMQKALQEKYKHKWEPICAETGKNKLLWMIGEIGEVIDIIKQNGGTKASSDAEIRKDLVEELSDVLMYLMMFCSVIIFHQMSSKNLTQTNLKETWKDGKKKTP